MSKEEMMTVKEAADYLKVSESVIKDMVKTKAIGKYGVAKSMKVFKKDIDKWLASLNASQEEILAMKRVVCHFKDYFKPENILMDFSADNKYEAIAIMSKKARDLKIVKDHKWLYEIVVAREELVSTAIGKGVALLHPRHMHPNKIK